MQERVDKEAHDIYYKDAHSPLGEARDPDEYIARFESLNLKPYFSGGTTKGYVRGRATRKLFQAAGKLERDTNQIAILDAGCGQGELSVYLALKGYRVIGVDISPVACANAADLAARFGADKQCTFLAEDLGNLSLEDDSVDFVIGHAALHHFIKYPGVPSEFARVMKKGAEGYFADSFGENKLYHLFHDKEKMKRLGDVSLTKPLIYQYFGNYFDVELTPADWFTMLDKLYAKLFPKGLESFARKISRVHYWLDRRIATSSRLTLYLSGSVMTTIRKR